MDLSHCRQCDLTNTGVSNNVNDGCVPFRCVSARPLVLCSRWFTGTPNVNGTEPPFMLQVTPVFLLPWPVKLSTVQGPFWEPTKLIPVLMCGNKPKLQHGYFAVTEPIWMPVVHHGCTFWGWWDICDAMPGEAAKCLGRWYPASAKPFGSPRVLREAGLKPTGKRVEQGTERDARVSGGDGVGWRRLTPLSAFFVSYLSCP